MPDTIANQKDTHIGEHAASNVVVVPNGGAPFWRWVGVMGIGTVLLAYFVPWLMNQNAEMQKQILEQSREGSAALVGAAEAMDGLSENVGELVDEQQEFRRDLQPLVRQLDRFTDAAEAIVQESQKKDEP